MSCSSLRGGSGTSHPFNFDAVISSYTSTMTSSPTSSPSSTISETSNVSIRTTRKRPNQTYNEAATLLSKAYPNLFRNFKNKQPGKFTKPITESNDYDSELLLPLRACHNDAVSFLLQNKSTFPKTEPERVFSVPEKLSNVSCGVVNPNELERDSGEDFDCESMLDEEIEEGKGIDSIIGSRVDDAAAAGGGERATSWFEGFGGKISWARALRRVDGGNWWNFVTVDVLEILPGMKNVPATEKKKKAEVEILRDSSHGLRLKLNYDDVRNAWSDWRLPFAGDCSTVRFSSPAGIKKSRRKKLKKENV